MAAIVSLIQTFYAAIANIVVQEMNGMDFYYHCIDYYRRFVQLGLSDFEVCNGCSTSCEIIRVSV